MSETRKLAAILVSDVVGTSLKGLAVAGVTHGSFSCGPPALAHPALRPLGAGVAPDMHDASGGSVGDDDAERADGIVQAEDALVGSACRDETIIVVAGHLLFAKAAAAGSMRLRPVAWLD